MTAIWRDILLDKLQIVPSWSFPMNVVKSMSTGSTEAFGKGSFYVIVQIIPSWSFTMNVVKFLMNFNVLRLHVWLRKTRVCQLSPGGFWQARFCLSIMTVETSTLTYIVFCDGQTKIHREVMSTIMVTVHRFNFIRGERTSSFSSASIADGRESRLTAEIKFYPTLPLRRKLFLSTSSLVNLMIQLTTPISHHASELPGIDRRICYIEDRHYGTVVAVFRGRPWRVELVVDSVSLGLFVSFFI